MAKRTIVTRRLKSSIALCAVLGAGFPLKTLYRNNGLSL